MRVSEISTPSATGSAPPDRPVPAPRATQGTPRGGRPPRRPAPVAVDPGSTTTPGVTAYWSRPSDS